MYVNTQHTETEPLQAQKTTLLTAVPQLLKQETTLVIAMFSLHNTFRTLKPLTPHVKE